MKGPKRNANTDKGKGPNSATLNVESDNEDDIRTQIQDLREHKELFRKNEILQESSAATEHDFLVRDYRVG